MALPTDIATVVVQIGPVVDFSGNTFDGANVTFRPSQRVIWAATGAPLWPRPIKVTLDENGVGSVMLPATDQDGFVLSPGHAIKDWTYTVTWGFPDRTIIAPDPYLIQLPAAAEVVDLDLTVSIDSEDGGTVRVKPVISVAGVDTLPAGSDATVDLVPDQSGQVFQVLKFGIPRGAKGDKGDKGQDGEITSAALTATLATTLGTERATSDKRYGKANRVRTFRGANIADGTKIDSSVRGQDGTQADDRFADARGALTWLATTGEVQIPNTTFGPYMRWAGLGLSALGVRFYARFDSFSSASNQTLATCLDAAGGTLFSVNVDTTGRISARTAAGSALWASPALTLGKRYRIEFSRDQLSDGGTLTVYDTDDQAVIGSGGFAWGSTAKVDGVKFGRKNVTSGGAVYTAYLSHLAVIDWAQEVGPAYRNPFYEPYSPSSPFNTAIGSGATFEAPTDPPTADWKAANPAINTKNWSIVPYKTDYSTPWGYVTNMSGGVAGQTTVCRIPKGAIPTAGTDQQVAIVQPDGVTVYEFYKFTPVDETHWTHTRVEINDLRSDGLSSGARVSSISLMAGLLRKRDCDLLSIPHAVAVGLPAQALSAGQSTSDGGYVWPSNYASGASDDSGHVPMGGLFALPPTVDITTLGLSPLGLALAKAMQDYGAYVTIQGANCSVYAEPDVDTYKPLLDAAWNVIQPLMRRVTNNSPTTVGGGGTPRQPAKLGFSPTVAAAAPPEVPKASSNTPGAITLAGDLTGTPDAPTVKLLPVAAWAATTAYRKYQLALSPVGAYVTGAASLIQSTSDHTSGATWSGANWTRVLDGNAVATPAFKSLFAGSAVATVANADTLICSSATQPSAALAGGQMYRFDLDGTTDAIAASGAQKIKLAFGPLNMPVETISSSQTVAATGLPWMINGRVYIESTGASGVVTCLYQVTTRAGGGGQNTPNASGKVSVPFDTTNGLTMSVFTQMATPNPGNVARVIHGSLVQAF